MDAKPYLLTEPEVAERLRCSTEKVKRLRLSGKLAYLKGRPVLISEADLLEFTGRDAYLLTQAEVAERLCCSITRVKYLRLSGELAYLRGRPVLISEADLLAFIARQQQKKLDAAALAASQRVVFSAAQRAQFKWQQRRNRAAEKRLKDQA